MKAVLQRVKDAHVKVDGRLISKIGRGLVTLLGVQEGDSQKDADYLADKIIHLRIFEDDAGKMNRSLLDINGNLLVVSQFTLLGDCRKGRRPSFVQAARPAPAEELYSYFTRAAAGAGIPTRTGRFGAMMDLGLTNWGPVTLVLDSREAVTR